MFHSWMMIKTIYLIDKLSRYSYSDTVLFIHSRVNKIMGSGIPDFSVCEIWQFNKI